MSGLSIPGAIQQTLAVAAAASRHKLVCGLVLVQFRHGSSTIFPNLGVRRHGGVGFGGLGQLVDPVDGLLQAVGAHRGPQVGLHLRHDVADLFEAAGTEGHAGVGDALIGVLVEVDVAVAAAESRPTLTMRPWTAVAFMLSLTVGPDTISTTTSTPRLAVAASAACRPSRACLSPAPGWRRNPAGVFVSPDLEVPAISTAPITAATFCIIMRADAGTGAVHQHRAALLQLAVGDERIVAGEQRQRQGGRLAVRRFLSGRRQSPGRRR